MDLGNMREQGVRGPAVYCLNHACLHRAVINVDNYPDEIGVPFFGLCMVSPRQYAEFGVRRPMPNSFPGLEDKC
jgi:hypothetical protein